MSGGLGQQEARVRLHDSPRLGEERGGGRHLVHDREGEHEVDGLLVRLESHRRRRRKPRLDTVYQSRPLGSPPQPCDHFRLDVHGDDAAGRTDESSEREREETHSRAGLEHSHARAHERFEHAYRILRELAQRAREEIASPPGTDSVFGHEKCFPREALRSARFRL